MTETAAATKEISTEKDQKKWLGEQTFSLTPRTLDEAMKYADMIAKSSIVPPHFKDKPGDVLVAIQMGAEVGLKPLQALQNIAIINQKPCIYGAGVRALILGSGKLEYCEETDDGSTAVCVMKRKGNPKVSRNTFSANDSKTAGLSEKDIWKKYPKRMRQWRAFSWCANDLFADILKGMAIREEVQDYELVAQVGDTQVLKPIAGPKAAVAAPAEAKPQGNVEVKEQTKAAPNVEAPDDGTDTVTFIPAARSTKPDKNGKERWAVKSAEGVWFTTYDQAAGSIAIAAAEHKKPLKLTYVTDGDFCNIVKAELVEG